MSLTCGYVQRDLSKVRTVDCCWSWKRQCSKAPQLYRCHLSLFLLMGKSVREEILSNCHIVKCRAHLFIKRGRLQQCSRFQFQFQFYPFPWCNRTYEITFKLSHNIRAFTFERRRSSCSKSAKASFLLKLFVIPMRLANHTIHRSLDRRGSHLNIPTYHLTETRKHSFSYQNQNNSNFIQLKPQHVLSYRKNRPTRTDFHLPSCSIWPWQPLGRKITFRSGQADCKILSVNCTNKGTSWTCSGKTGTDH